MSNESHSPIQSGWRGNLNGAIEKTSTSYISVTEITLRLDRDTAWALCNLLTDAVIGRANAVEGTQIESLSNLGAGLGRLIDHPSGNNGGRSVLK